MTASVDCCTGEKDGVIVYYLSIHKANWGIHFWAKCFIAGDSIWSILSHFAVIRVTKGKDLAALCGGAGMKGLDPKTGVKGIWIAY